MQRETDQGVLNELAMYFDLYPGPDQIDILIRRFDDLGGILPRCLVASAQAGHKLPREHGRMIQKHLRELRADADRQEEVRHTGPLQLVNSLIGGLMEFDDPDLAPIFEENLVYALKVPPGVPIHNQVVPLAGSCLLALETLKFRGLASLLNVYGDSAGILSDSAATRHIGKILTTLPEDQESAAVEVCRGFQSKNDLLPMLQRISADTYMYTAEERRKVDRLRADLC